jgi:nitric oxide reductase subunit B
MNGTERRAFLLSSTWIQAACLVFVFGFFVLGFLAFRNYAGQSPLPAKTTDPAGKVLFTADDVTEGQGVFLRNGLMQYGSVYGHGAYLGPDFTADYLRRAAESVKKSVGGDPAKVVEAFKTNRYDEKTSVLTFTAEQAAAFEALVEHYGEYFGQPGDKTGLRPGAISDPAEIRKLTSFFAWTAWTASARRPGLSYSYTNNWPPEPRVDNRPTAECVVWSMLSLAALLGGIGLLMGAFGRYEFLGWHGRDRASLSFRRPDTVTLTPAQRSTAWFFLVMSALFLLQTLVGGASQHYRAEISNFFGIPLFRHFPYNVARTWHVQLAIFWVATSFLAAGIFIAPMVAGREPKGQHYLSFALLGALAVVVFGSLFGEYAGIFGWIRNFWFGNQGFEYLDLGRFWQILLSIGLAFWVVILYRGLSPRLAIEHRGNMPWLFFFSALAIPAFYAVGLLAHPASHFTTSDFWRFWVVHLWVEDFLELFTTVMVAYIFVLLGAVEEKIALRVIYLDIILYSAGGVIGTMHHLYFSGEPAEHMALGAFFSAAEVIPLTFLTVEAWSFMRLGALQQEKSRTPFPHRWAVLFLVAVGFWNFLGAGVFGFLINLPVVSYFEIGTALTANHGHAAMMGVYGMLAAGLALFALRYLIPEEKWPESAARVSFWSLNIGLAWMVFATLFPLGLLQLFESVSHGYVEARELKFLESSTMRSIEWLRLPGDIVFILGGALPLLYICLKGVLHARPAGAAPSAEPVRLADVTLPAEVH